MRTKKPKGGKSCPHRGFMRTRKAKKKEKLSSYSVHEDKKSQKETEAVFIETS